MSNQQVKPEASRRKFLTGAAAAATGAATLGFPMIAKSQSPIVHQDAGRLERDRHLQRDGAMEFVNRVNADVRRPAEDRLPGRRRGGQAVRGDRRGQQGRARRRPHRAGVLVRQVARSPRCSAPARSTAWTPSRRCPGSIAAAGSQLYHELLRQARTSTYVGFFAMPMPTQPLGWFKKPITRRAAAQGPQVPHRGPGRRPVAGNGLQGDPAAGRRDHPGPRARRDRRFRVQQPDLGQPLRRPGRDQELR